jgi:hypothetical protein
VDQVDSDEEKTAEQEREDSTLLLTESVPAKSIRLPHQTEEGQSVLQTIIMVIGAIILVILLVLFARWIYHKVHHTNTSPSSGTTQLPEQSYNSGSQSGAKQQSGNSGGSSSSNSSPAPSTPNSQTITNTGPGNVAAVFAGSTLAAAGLHYIVSLRRFNKSGD